MKNNLPELKDSMRIAKFIAGAGICSRRAADRLIEEGRVIIDGKQIDTPAILVNHESKILVDNKLISLVEKPRLWLYYKPVGLITSHYDPQGRPTVFDNLPDHMPRVISVGRLDLNSEGLMLLTNSGELARSYELPSNQLIRKYKVRVYGPLDLDKLKTLEDGIEIDGMHYLPVKINFYSQKGMNAWLDVELQEGKNREIRKLLAHFGLQVSRLIRVAYGPYSLGDLEPEDIQEVTIESN